MVHGLQFALRHLARSFGGSQRFSRIVQASNSVLPAWITPKQYLALQRVATAFDRLGAPYMITGALAGNLHGSLWPLHDIDLDTSAAVLPTLVEQFSAHVQRGPVAYQDDEFEITLLTLDLHGVSVDVSAAESVVLRAPDGSRHPWPTDLGVWVDRSLGDLRLRAQPLERLIEYKRFLGRVADLADLEHLSLAAEPRVSADAGAGMISAPGAGAARRP